MPYPSATQTEPPSALKTVRESSGNGCSAYETPGERHRCLSSYVWVSTGPPTKS